MSNIFQAYFNALLADATYALGVPEQGNLDGATGNRLTGYLETRMTPTLAKYLGDNFTVVSHIETDDTFASGFDATVWRENATGKLTVSMQGTSGFQDFLTDVKLAFTGNAGQQVIDMANWRLKITTPVGQQARQIGHTVDAVSAFVSAASDVPGMGLVSAADLARGVEVNGHSLGGYLATAFTRLFGALAHVTHTSTFNGAGFPAGSEPDAKRGTYLIVCGAGHHSLLGRPPNTINSISNCARSAGEKCKFSIENRLKKAQRHVRCIRGRRNAGDVLCLE